MSTSFVGKLIRLLYLSDGSPLQGVGPLTVKIWAHSSFVSAQPPFYSIFNKYTGDSPLSPTAWTHARIDPPVDGIETSAMLAVSC